MKSKLPVLLASFLLLGGCAAVVGPVEVTRFHVADVTPLGKGTIAVEPGAGMDGNSLELKTYMAAVTQQLDAIGYRRAEPGAGDQVALVRLERTRERPERTSGPVSVGLGGSTGSFGSGVGLGIGLNLGGKPAEQVETRLAVAIRDRASDTVLWEGRASHVAKANSPLADTQLGAAKIAEALFSGFPGNSGETIQVP